MARPEFLDMSPAASASNPTLTAGKWRRESLQWALPKKDSSDCFRLVTPIYTLLIIPI